MTDFWYCVRSKPNKEEFLYAQLVQREIEACYPRLRVKPVNPRSRKVKPYFPGYMFARVDPDHFKLSDLHLVPGASGLVSFGGEPAFVSDSLIQAICRRVNEINANGYQELNRLRPGDVVTIQTEPFIGYEAIFEASLSGDERVRVLIKLLNDRQMPVELSAGSIQRKS